MKASKLLSIILSCALCFSSFSYEAYANEEIKVIEDNTTDVPEGFHESDSSVNVISDEESGEHEEVPSAAEESGEREEISYGDEEHEEKEGNEDSASADENLEERVEASSADEEFEVNDEASDADTESIELLQLDGIEAHITLYTTSEESLDSSKYVKEESYEAYASSYNAQMHTFTFSYGAEAEYSVAGESVTVSDAGVVEPAYQTMYYWDYGSYISYSSSPGNGDYSYTKKDYYYGDSAVTVTVDGHTCDYIFTTQDYSKVYVDEVINTYLRENISDSMTDLEKLTVIAQFPALYDYSVYHSAYSTMVLYGGGDCWSSTYAIVELCNRVGIPAHVRYAADDSGAGSGHRNAAALINGTVYICEAGYVGTAPRSYHIYEENIGYTVTSNGTVLHYDGFETDLVIPDVVSGKTVTQIGALAFSSYRCPMKITSLVLPSTLATLQDQSLESIDGITSIHLPVSVSTIGNFVFTDCEKLQSITVDENNAFFSDDNGVLYDKNKTTLLYYPTAGAAEYTIADSANCVQDYAFYYTTGVKKVVVPANVSSIGVGAFGSSNIREIYFYGDRPQIEQYAFANLDCTVYYPLGNETWEGIEQESFGNDSNVKYKTWNVPSTDKNDQTLHLSVSENDLEVGEETYISHDGNGTVKYRSSDETVAVVYDDGRVIATGVGTAQISVTVEGDRYYNSARAELELRVVSGNTLVAQGDCGDSAKWMLDSAGNLLIYGSDATEDYNIRYGIRPPWYQYRDSIYRVIVGSEITELGSYALCGLRGVQGIEMSDQVTELGYGSIGWCSASESLRLSSGLTTIGDCAFYNDTLPETVIIPDSVTKIGNNAFAAISGTKKIYIPESVTSIGTGAVSSLGEITIYGKTGSAAETYAKDNDIDFVPVDIQLSAYKLEVGKDFVLKYYLEMPESLAADAGSYMSFDMSGEVKTTNSYEAEGDYLVYSCAFPAAMMTEQIKASFTYDGITVQLSSYSAKEYLTEIIENRNQDSDYAKAHDLAVAILNYGGASQSYFQYYLNNRANISLSETELDRVSEADMRDRIQNTMTGISENENFRFYGASLICESDLQLRLYFENNSGLTLNQIKTAYPVSVSGLETNTVQMEASGSLIYLTICCVKPFEIGNLIQVQIGNTVNDINMTYCPLIYLKKAMDSENSELKNLCKALYGYYSEAVKYSAEN